MNSFGQERFGGRKKRSLGLGLGLPKIREVRKREMMFYLPAKTTTEVVPSPASMSCAALKSTNYSTSVSKKKKVSLSLYHFSRGMHDGHVLEDGGSVVGDDDFSSAKLNLYVSFLLCSALSLFLSFLPFYPFLLGLKKYGSHRQQLRSVNNKSWGTFGSNNVA